MKRILIICLSIALTTVCESQTPRNSTILKYSVSMNAVLGNDFGADFIGGSKFGVLQRFGKNNTYFDVGVLYTRKGYENTRTFTNVKTSYLTLPLYYVITPRVSN